MKILSVLSIAVLSLLFLPVQVEFETVSQEAADSKGCLSCHESIESFTEGVMMDTIKVMGGQDTRDAQWGNYDIKDEDGARPAVGRQAYKDYMEAFAAAHPEQVPTELQQVPEVDVNEISQHPNLAGITYSRQQCQRCHVGVTGREKRGDFRGTVDRFPWDLPVGYGEEFQQPVSDEPRGLTDKLPDCVAFGTIYRPEDGYLLTARGNPFGNVVKKGGKVIVHSASGLDFESPVLKALEETDGWKNDSAKVAMGKVTQHRNHMLGSQCLVSRSVSL